MARFRLVLLGGLAVHRISDGSAIESIQRRQLAILARLAMSRGAGMSRDHLLSYFWGDRPEANARSLLRQGIHANRRAIDADVFREAQSNLRINEELLTTDALEFERTLALGQRRQACQLYTGSFLEGMHIGCGAEFDNWAANERVRLANLCVLALDALGGDPLESPQQRTEWWRRSLSILPLRSHAATGLLCSLMEAGERAEALSFGTSYQGLLEKAYQIPLDEGVAALLSSIRSGDVPVKRGSAPWSETISTPRSDVSGVGIQRQERRDVVSFEKPRAAGRARHTTLRRIAMVGSVLVLIAGAAWLRARIVRGTGTPAAISFRARASGSRENIAARESIDDSASLVLYVQAQNFLSRRTLPSIEHSIELFRAAIARKKNFARAHAALALASALLPSFDNRPPRPSRDEAMREAHTALSLDTAAAQAYVALALLSLDAHDWSGAERELRKAIAIDTTDALGHFYLSCLVGTEDRATESLDEARTAFALDPLSNPVAANLGAAYYDLGRNEEAELQLRQSLELDSTYSAAHQVLGLVLLSEHRNAEALQEMRASVRFDGAHPYAGDLGILGYGYAIAGDARSAHRILVELDSIANAGYVDPAAQGVVWMGLGDRDRAFALFEQSVKVGGALFLDYFQGDPIFNSLRVDPRYSTLTAQLNLPARSSPQAH